jgi:hypothetical protein
LSLTSEAISGDRESAMSKPIKVQVIERARALIADERHWCPGDLARDRMGYSVSPTDRDAEQRCALGALVAAAYEITGDPRQARDLAMTAMRPLVGATQLTLINDTEGHGATLTLFDGAIAAIRDGDRTIAKTS